MCIRDREWTGCLMPGGTYSDVEAAENANMVYWAPGYDLAEVAYELNDCNTAAVYSNSIEIGYCDPAGEYLVQVWALDIGGKTSEMFFNEFEILRLACCEYDFSSINWNTIKLGGHQVVSGDKDMATTTRPTVENMGNIDILINVKEDALTDAAGVEYTKNCMGCDYYVYDAKMLGWGNERYFYPGDDWVTLDGYVQRCGMEGLCFSLEILQAMPAGSYTGQVYIDCADANLDPCCHLPIPE